MDRRAIKKIVVVGGGSAGWLTALYAKTVMPDKEVTVIESEAIGILGAGEGTTPDIVRLLDTVGVPVSELVKHTGCTIKNGIKFQNWNGGGEEDYFYHGFFAYGNLSSDAYELSFMESTAPFIYTGSVAKAEPFGKADLASKISYSHKTPFLKNNGATDSQQINPIFDYVNIGSFALHIDAAKLADYLRKVATEDRKIKRVEGILVDFVQDDTGDVKKLKLDSGLELSCDFVFDCSGFARFFSKRLGASWVGYEDMLPSDSALPFFLSIDESDPIPTAGLAIAMNNGWMWKTPLQHRYGCGYVFDSSRTSFDEVQKEVEAYLGLDIEPIKEIKYKAGYYSNPWQHNVISVGLASGFLEPLEASSMWTTNISLSRVFSNSEVLFNRDPKVSQEFNKKFCSMSEEVSEFVYFHHMTNRTDTNFWRSFSLDKAPEGVQVMMDLFEIRLPGRDDFLNRYWQLDSWYKVGLGHHNKTIEQSIKRSIAHNSFTRSMLNTYDQYKLLTDSAADLCVDHRDFLEHLKK